MSINHFLSTGGSPFISEGNVGESINDEIWNFIRWTRWGSWWGKINLVLELQLNKNAIHKCRFEPDEKRALWGQLGERYVPAAKISCKLTQNLSTHLQHRSSDRKVHLAFHRNVILPKDHRRYNRHGFTYLLFVFAVTNRLCKQMKESWCYIMMFLNSTQG